jgi:hypothetical protein
MDITVQDLQIICALSVAAGVFLSFWLTRLFEVVHTWQMFQRVVLHLLYMAVGLVEDVEFIRQVKERHLREAGYTPEQIRAFQEVDDYNLTQWKENVIIKLVTRMPPRFRSMMPFTNYREASRYIDSELKELAKGD